MTDEAASPPASLPALVQRVAADALVLDRELAEIEMLVAQARTEATRHEARRAQTAEKLTAAAGRADPAELADLNASLLMLTKRTALMEAQVDILNGKQRVLQRYRDSLGIYGEVLGSLARGLPAGDGGLADEGGTPGLAGHRADAGHVDPRLVLTAQEDLRREIARAMHDGPAQSLTNIVLQAQIVDRLLGRDEAMARGELRLLMDMVQQTLEATKSFIFDVRPMVLDDLGLVPTLRRTARERGRRSQVPITFESTGQDRRLSMELESGLFRIVDETLAAYVERRPERVELTMAWDSELVVEVGAIHAIPEPTEPAAAQPAEDLPPALAAMIEDRRTEALPDLSKLALPGPTWRDAEDRAASLGIAAELREDGRRLRLAVSLPAPD